MKTINFKGVTIEAKETQAESFTEQKAKYIGVVRSLLLIWLQSGRAKKQQTNKERCWLL